MTSPPSTIRRPEMSPARFGIVGAVLFALVGIAWSWSSPLLGAPDESAQVIRAAAVARGQLRGDDVTTRSEAPPGENRVDTTFDVPEGYAETGQINNCYIFQPEQPVGCAPQPSGGNDEVRASTYIGTYPPLYYALVGWPTLFMTVPGGLWAMRISSVIVSAALVGLALTAVRRAGARGLVSAGLLIALTPMALFLASVINPSGMEITAAVALWATALAVVVSPFRVSRADLVRLAVAFVALAACRPLSPVIAVGILASVAIVGGFRERFRSLWIRTDVRWTSGIMAAALVVATGWVVWTNGLSRAAGVPVPGLTLTEALRGSWERLPTRVVEMIGYFAYREVPAPRSLVVLWSVLVVAAVVGAAIVGTWRQRILLAALIVASVVFNVVPEAVSAEEYGFIWQGRYALPVAAGVPILAAWIIGASPRWRARWTVATVGVVGLAWALGQAIGQGSLLRRNAIGLTHPYFSFLGADGWSPPLPIAVLWILLLVTCLLVAGWCTMGARSDVAELDDDQPVPRDLGVDRSTNRPVPAGETSTPERSH